MKKWVKFLIAGVLVLAIAGGVIYSMTAPIAAPLTAVSAKTVELAFSEQGLAVADNVVQVYSPAQGQLLRVHVQEGQNVRAGDILCEIDPEPLRLQMNQLLAVSTGYEAQIAQLDVDQNRQRDELQTSRNRLNAELRSIEAQERSSNQNIETQNISVDERLRLQNLLIEQGMSDVSRIRDELRKAEVLYEAGSMPRSEYEAAIDALAKAESAVEAARLEASVIESGRSVTTADYFTGAKAAISAQIEGINQSLARNYTGAMRDYYDALISGNEAAFKQLEHEIANCTVVAPVDGIITKLNVRSTNMVSAALPVAEITVPGGSTVEVYVSTQDVDSIKVGDTVELTLKRREGDAVFTGDVRDIGTTAEIRLSNLGVEERKVRVRVNPHTHMLQNASFGVGYSVDVKFFVYRADNKFAVPKTALYKDGANDMLWVVRGGTAEAIAVTKGMELRTETVIESGLQNGDFVVTDANNSALRNGVRISDE